MEIERKWLCSKWPPSDYECIKNLFINQVYLHVDDHCEVRLCTSINLVDSSEKYVLTTKVGNGLSRVEIESNIPREDFLKLVQDVKQDSICKQYRKFKIPGSKYHLDMSIVDGKWMYAEVEFPTEEEALVFECPFPDWKEVTNDSKYSMKNYWKNQTI